MGDTTNGGRHSGSNGAVTATSRRHLLRIAGVGATAGLAGCGGGSSEPRITRALARVPTPKELAEHARLRPRTLQVALLFENSAPDADLSDVITTTRGDVRDVAAAPFEWYRPHAREPEEVFDPDGSVGIPPEFGETPEPELDIVPDRTIRGHVTSALAIDRTNGGRWTGGRTGMPGMELRSGYHRADGNGIAHVRFSDGYVYSFPRSFGPGSNGGYPDDWRYDLDPRGLSVENVGESFVGSGDDANFRDLACADGEDCPDLSPVNNNEAGNSPLVRMSFGRAAIDPSLDGRRIGAGTLFPAFEHRPTPLLTTLSALTRGHARAAANLARYLTQLDTPGEYVDEVWERATDAVEATAFAAIGSTPVDSIGDVGMYYGRKAIPPAALAFYGQRAYQFTNVFNTVLGYAQGLGVAMEETGEFARLVERSPGDVIPIGEKIRKEACREPIERVLDPDESCADRDLVVREAPEGHAPPWAIYSLVRYLGTTGTNAVGCSADPARALRTYRKLLTESYYQFGAIQQGLVRVADFQMFDPEERRIVQDASERYAALQRATRRIAAIAEDVDAAYQATGSPFEQPSTESENDTPTPVTRTSSGTPTAGTDPGADPGRTLTRGFLTATLPDESGGGSPYIDHLSSLTLGDAEFVERFAMAAEPKQGDSGRFTVDAVRGYERASRNDIGGITMDRRFIAGDSTLGVLTFVGILRGVPVVVVEHQLTNPMDRRLVLETARFSNPRLSVGTVGLRNPTGTYRFHVAGHGTERFADTEVGDQFIVDSDRPFVTALDERNHGLTTGFVASPSITHRAVTTRIRDRVRISLLARPIVIPAGETRSVRLAIIPHDNAEGHDDDTVGEAGGLMGFARSAFAP
jgi:hypothetical protein